MPSPSSLPNPPRWAHPLTTDMYPWLEREPTAVYILDTGYIGITRAPARRLDQHRADRRGREMTILLWCPCRCEALLWEEHLKANALPF